jgi:predicted PP-loop superfamily ATPase
MNKKNIDRKILEDIKESLVDYRMDIEKNIIDSKNIKLSYGCGSSPTIEIAGSKDEDPIELFFCDMLPKNKQERKEYLKLLKEYCEEELGEMV